MYTVYTVYRLHTQGFYLLLAPCLVHHADIPGSNGCLKCTQCTHTQVQATEMREDESNAEPDVILIWQNRRWTKQLIQTMKWDKWFHNNPYVQSFNFRCSIHLTRDILEEKTIMWQMQCAPTVREIVITWTDSRQFRTETKWWMSRSKVREASFHYGNWEQVPGDDKNEPDNSVGYCKKMLRESFYFVFLVYTKSM